jgi:hypothetical protein
MKRSWGTAVCTPSSRRFDRESALALDALAETDSWIEMSRVKSHEPFLHVERARARSIDRDDITCQRELREAHPLFLEIDAPIRGQQVAKELDR